MACADAAAVDKGTNKLSLFNIFEEMTAVVFPAILPTLTLVAVFTKTPSEPGATDIEVRIAHGSQNAALPTPIDFLGNNRMRLILTIQAIQVLEAKPLHFSIWHKNKQLGAEWTVEVHSVGPQVLPSVPVAAANTVTSSSQGAAPKAPKRRAKRS